MGGVFLRWAAFGRRLSTVLGDAFLGRRRQAVQVVREWLE